MAKPIKYRVVRLTTPEGLDEPIAVLTRYAGKVHVICGPLLYDEDYISSQCRLALQWILDNMYDADNYAMESGACLAVAYEGLVPDDVGDPVDWIRRNLFQADALAPEESRVLMRQTLEML